MQAAAWLLRQMLGETRLQSAQMKAAAIDRFFWRIDCFNFRRAAWLIAGWRHVDRLVRAWLCRAQEPTLQTQQAPHHEQTPLAESTARLRKMQAAAWLLRQMLGETRLQSAQMKAAAIDRFFWRIDCCNFRRAAWLIAGWRHVDRLVRAWLCRAQEPTPDPAGAASRANTACGVDRKVAQDAGSGLVAAPDAG